MSESEPKRPRRRRPAPPAEVEAPEPTAAEAAEVADATERAAAAARSRPRNTPLIIAGVVAAALVVGWLATRSSGPPPAVDAKGQSIEIIAEQDTLPEGTIVQVYFRTVPAGRPPSVLTYARSFPVTAEKSPSGGGMVTRQQLVAGFAAAQLPGHIVEIWVVDKKAGTPLDDWRSSGASVMYEGDLQRRHVVDAEGRALIFVDFATWAPGEPEPDCSQDFDCIGRGKCTGRQGFCVAANDADCAKTERCKKDGQCVAREGECKVGDDAACSRLDACTKEGRCTAKDGSCVATSVEACAASLRCKDLLADEECIVESGGCHRKTSRTWKPTAAADCAKSSVCLTFGRCGFRDEKCVASSDEGCAASEWCRDLGHCGRLEDSCAARTAAHCEASKHCKVFGKCGLIDDACFPTKDEHCRAAEACTTFKRCERADMQCK